MDVEQNEELKTAIELVTNDGWLHPLHHTNFMPVKTMLDNSELRLDGGFGTAETIYSAVIAANSPIRSKKHATENRFIVSKLDSATTAGGLTRLNRNHLFREVLLHRTLEAWFTTASYGQLTPIQAHLLIDYLFDVGMLVPPSTPTPIR